jgi:A/G-specific adenine glycosylase
VVTVSRTPAEGPSRRYRAIRRRLLDWYDRNRRDLPWRRRAGDPYAQWVAEVMLQQTRVPTVLAYYERFLRRFPTMNDLARADYATALKCWEGLGYYRRILHLHRAARLLQRQGRGVPHSAEELAELPGVGGYVSRAVASIAFGERVAAVDGNVARVIARLFGVDEDVQSGARRARIQAIADRALSAARPGDFNQAWMDLGSLICTPLAPRCEVCPLRGQCEARRMGRVEKLPVRESSRRASRRSVQAIAAVFVGNGRILVRRRPLEGLWPGLWEVPTEERVRGQAGRCVVLRLAEFEGVQLCGKPRRVGVVKHELTHRSLTFSVYLAAVQADGAASGNGQPRRWVTPGMFRRLGVSTAHRRIMAAAAASKDWGELCGT